LILLALFQTSPLNPVTFSIHNSYTVNPILDQQPKYPVKGAVYVDAFPPNVLAFFLNYLCDISFNPKILSQDHSASSHKSEKIKVNVKKKKRGGGGGVNFKKNGNF